MTLSANINLTVKMQSKKMMLEPTLNNVNGTRRTNDLQLRSPATEKTWSRHLVSVLGMNKSP